LENSSRIRSIETVGGCSRPACARIADSTLGSRLNCRVVANRAARSIRSGSSSKVEAGSSGVMMRRASRSCNARPVRSSTVPSQSISKLLMVKSRRTTSSFSVPGRTSGFRLLGS